MRRSQRGSQHHTSNEDFESPDPSNDETSYQLSYTNGNLESIVDSDGPSTSRAAAAQLPQKKFFARKSTATGPYGRQSSAKGASNQNLRGRQLPMDVINESESDTAARNVPAAQNVRARKQKKPMSKAQRDLRFLKEVRKLQNETGFLVPRLPFGRVVREIILKNSFQITSITKEALEGLQYSTELYMTQVFNDAYLLTLHRKRVTLSVEDFEILRVFRMINSS